MLIVYAFGYYNLPVNMIINTGYKWDEKKNLFVLIIYFVEPNSFDCGFTESN